MTVQEAIYCMKTYLPDSEASCTDCQYYGAVDDGDNVFTCKSSEAHELAIKALEQMKSLANTKNTNAVHAFMGEVRSLSARKSQEIADEMADMVLFYARMRSNAEELDKAWEA